MSAVDPKSRPSGRDAFLLSLRAAVAGAIAFICYQWTQLPGASWAPVSAVLVMESTLRPSLRLSLIRVAGNLVGALCGVGASLSFGPTPLAIGTGLLVTGILCHVMRLDDGRRPAYVAMLIILTNNGGGGVFHGLVDRLAAVVIGCFVALLVAFVFELAVTKTTLASTGEDTGE